MSRVEKTGSIIEIRGLVKQETPLSFLTSAEYLDFIGEVRGIPDVQKKADWWFDFLLPGWLLVKQSYRKWESWDQPEF